MNKKQESKIANAFKDEETLDALFDGVAVKVFEDWVRADSTEKREKLHAEYLAAKRIRTIINAIADTKREPESNA